MSQADPGDLRPHRGPVCTIERQKPQQAIVARRFEIAIDEPVRQVGPPAVFQIHGEERDLAGDIDPAQALVELQTVEDGHRLVEQEHVPQMQIPVAFAHEPILFASNDIAPTRGKGVLAPGLKLPGVYLPGGVVDAIEQVLKVVVHRLIDRLWGAKGARRVCSRVG